MNTDLQKALQFFYDKKIAETGNPPTIEEMNLFLMNITHSINNSPKQDFEGYSPEQMRQILDNLFSDSSLIKLNELSPEEYLQIPLFRQVIKLTSILCDTGKIKLTPKNALPLAIVREIYSVGTPDWYIDKHLTKRLTEADSMTVQRTLIILKLLSAIKIQKGVMTLTAKGKKLIGNHHQLLKSLLHTFTYEFNWEYFDGYEHPDVGRTGVGFSLILLSKYGKEWKRDNFYAEKYFKAFPMLSMEKRWREEIAGESCYSIRTFSRFMLEFGLIEIKEENVEYIESTIKLSLTHLYIRKTPLFDKILSFKQDQK